MPLNWTRIAIAEAHGAAGNLNALTRAVDALLALDIQFGNAEGEWLHDTIRIHFQYGGRSDMEAACRTANNANKRSASHLAVAEYLMNNPSTRQ